MESKFAKFPKIGSFKNTIEDLKKKLCFNGLNEEGYPLYDFDREIPLVLFRGTVKVHGTNAGFRFENDDLAFQKRKSDISLLDDNYGFCSAFSSEEKISKLKALSKKIRQDFHIPSSTPLILYGEWAGGNVQKGVGVSKLPKRFYLFGIKTKIGSGEDSVSQWYPISGYKDESIGLYNIEDFGVFEILVDLKNPKDVQDKLVKITDDIENECPVAKFFGVSGVGEGVVWTATLKNGDFTRFKVKGDKHSVVKTKGKKEKASIDPIKMKNIQDFSNYAVTENRLKQCIQELFGESKPPTKKDTGKVIKWMIQDIIQEEGNTISSNGLTAKEVKGAISNKVKDLFFKSLDNC